MESLKLYLDGLPKKGLDWLKDNYLESDKIYKYSGALLVILRLQIKG
jgi:hypothetical protein